MTARPLLVAALLLAARAAAAQETAVVPGSLPEFVGPRTLALSAGVGLVTANDGLFANPGALAARKRYSVEAGYYVDRRGGDNVARFFGTSIVDSTSSPVTAAVGYYRLPDDGGYEGQLGLLALAFPIADKVWLGASGKWLRLDSPVGDANAVTSDVGLFWELSRWVTIGAAGYNVIPISHEDVAPLGFGAGLTVGSEQGFQVTADWRSDLERSAAFGGADETRNRYGFGAEYLLRFIALRAGYQHDEILDTDWVSGGVGFIRGSLAIDAGYRQSLDQSSARTIAVSLRLFLFD